MTAAAAAGKQHMRACACDRKTTTKDFSTIAAGTSQLSPPSSATSVPIGLRDEQINV
jgi:hypothetical protein